MLTASGRLQDRALTATDRTVAMWMHLSALLAFVIIWPFAGIAPLVLWLARRDSSPFADDHGREVVNMSITGVILFCVGLVTGIGIVAWLIWLIVALVSVVRGAVAANRGEYFRYPMTIRAIQQVSALRSAISQESASELDDAAAELRAVGAELKAVGAELKADFTDR